MMLPPPTTTPISTPSARTSAISWAVCWICRGAIPKPASPARLCPETFFPELVTQEAPDFGAHLLGRGRDALVGIHHEGLLHEHHLLEELAEPTLDHLVDDVLGLPLLLRLRPECGALALDLLGRKVLARDARRVGRGHVHAQIAGEGAHLRVRRIVGRDLDQRADLASRVGIAADVRPLRSVDSRETAHLDVLAHLGDRARQQILDARGSRLRAEQGADIRRILVSHHLGDLIGERAEVVGLCHEVGLAVELDQRAAPAIVRHAGCNAPLRGGASRPLASLEQPALAEQVGSPLEVAVRLDQDPLAVHHPRPGPLPERLHLCR
jgi:hypothetical protein